MMFDHYKISDTDGRVVGHLRPPEVHPAQKRSPLIQKWDEGIIAMRKYPSEEILVHPRQFRRLDWVTSPIQPKCTENAETIACAVHPRHGSEGDRLGDKPNPFVPAVNDNGKSDFFFAKKKVPVPKEKIRTEAKVTTIDGQPKVSVSVTIPSSKVQRCECQMNGNESFSIARQTKFFQRQTRKE